MLINGDDSVPSYDQLKDMMLKGEPITAQYSLRNGSTRTGKTSGGYTGSYLITSLELDGQAGDDAKYSVKLENCGEVKKEGTGLTGTTDSETSTEQPEQTGE